VAHIDGRMRSWAPVLCGGGTALAAAISSRRAFFSKPAITSFCMRLWGSASPPPTGKPSMGRTRIHPQWRVVRSPQCRHAGSAMKIPAVRPSTRRNTAYIALWLPPFRPPSRCIAECKSYHINLQACQYVTVEYATYGRECPWAFEFHRIALILGLPRKIKERIKNNEDNGRNGIGRTMP
jgi:hypothetical protein